MDGIYSFWEKLHLISTSTYFCWFQSICHRLFSTDPNVLLIVHITLCHRLWCVFTVSHFTTVRKDRGSHNYVSAKLTCKDMHYTYSKYKDTFFNIIRCTIALSRTEDLTLRAKVCRWLWPRQLTLCDPVFPSENERCYHPDLQLPFIAFLRWFALSKTPWNVSTMHSLLVSLVVEKELSISYRILSVSDRIFCLTLL